MKTETQDLPDGWNWQELREICEIVMGQSPPSSTYRKSPEGLPFFQGKADFGDESPKPTTWCVEPKKVAERGDILISVRAPVGPTNIADTQCCIGRGLAALRCRKSVNRDFLLAYLKLFESEISRMGSGSTFKAIRKETLSSLTVPLPPLVEQERIVATLNRQLAAVDRALLAALEQVDAIQEMPAALLRNAFKGNM